VRRRRHQFSSAADQVLVAPTLRLPREWLLGVALIIFVVLAYARVFHAGFVWDDEQHLTENPCIIGPLGLKEIWTTERAVYYPLVLTSFWIVHQFVGLNPAPYHALTVLMHAACAILVWRVLCELRVRGAWLGAAIWALHPVIVQSVAWVTELKNTQSCLFYLLSIFCFLKIGDARNLPARWSRFALSLLFFLMAIVSKPSTVMLPVVIALCLWWKKSSLQWRDLARLIPFVAVSLLASAWTIWQQKFQSGAMGGDWAQSPPERLIIAGRAVWFYLEKLVWPVQLAFIYPRWQIDPSRAAEYLPFAGVVVALVYLWLNRRGWMGPAFFAAAYFIISLFPVLGFFSVFFFRYSFVSDHFQYLASIGPLAFFAAALTTGFGVSPWRSFRFALSGMLLFALGAMTWRQTGIYRNVITLYEDTLAKNPNCWMAHYNLGIALRAQGEIDQAVAHYRQAVILRPNYTDAHFNLARLLANKGEFDAAVGHYEAVLALHPDDAEAHNNLGNTLFRLGRVMDAISHFKKALAIKPQYPEASLNFADALLAEGDEDGAIQQYSAGLAQLPDHAPGQYNLANVLFRRGRVEEAISHYRKAIELDAHNPDARANLGSAFLQQGHIEAAIAEYRAALQIAPDNLAAQSNLAWLLATSANEAVRNGAEAVRIAENANRLSGANRPSLLRILAAAYAEMGRFNEAIETGKRALELAESTNNAALTRALENELALYRSGSPYHKQ
jgi:tetratricopeptide (TPR) repeat protein